MIMAGSADSFAASGEPLDLLGIQSMYSEPGSQLSPTGQPFGMPTDTHCYASADMAAVFRTEASGERGCTGSGSTAAHKRASADGPRQGRTASQATFVQAQARLTAQQAQFKQLAAENTVLRTKLKILERALPARDETVAFLTHTPNRSADAPSTASPSQSSADAPSHHGAPATAGSGTHMSNILPEVTPDTVDQLQKTTAAEFRRVWVRAAQALGLLVQGAEAHGVGSPQYSKLVDSVQLWLLYVNKITQLAPDAFIGSMYVNLDTGEQERPSEQWWAHVGTAMALNPAQLSEVLCAKAAYHRNVAPIHAERGRISEQLSTLAGLSVSQTSASDTTELNHLTAIDELTDQLRRNALKEHASLFDVKDFLTGSTFTPLQVAKALVTSYPYVPDCMALMHALAEQAEQAQPAAAGSGSCPAATQK